MFGKRRPTAETFKEKLCFLIADEERNAAFVKAFQVETKAEVKAFFCRFCLLEWLCLFYFQKERRDVRFFDLFLGICVASPLSEQAYSLNEFFVSDHERREALVNLTEASKPFPILDPVPFNKLVAIAMRIRNTAYNKRAVEAIKAGDLTVLQLGLLEEVRTQLGCAETQFSPFTHEGRAQFSCISHEFASMKLLLNRL